MNLLDLIDRSPNPKPWSEGDNIPWHESGFSRRMLKEHLTQDHGAASRRLEKIENHVDWLHRSVLEEKPVKILDLGCGPGLYTSRLARKGHDCVGIDYSPASIAYAEKQAKKEKLKCSYLQKDIRKARYGSKFGLVMLTYGEFNVFKIDDVKKILKKARSALAKDGILLLEVHTYNAIRKIGEESRSWYSSHKGLFSDEPHLLLSECFWDTSACIATKRYYTVDARNGETTRHAQSFQAYTDRQYRQILSEHGFGSIKTYDSLHGETDEAENEFVVLVSRKR
ncbi:MAG: class I SAM-dependent methyltransferase [Proteobacteria bacterium]|nr:class I SAM-dependent methyltransferase [Pseudomonadota bacterium]